MNTKKRKREREFTTVPDGESNRFTKSSCNCDSCTNMHNSVKEWNTFTPKTSLQTRMLKVVAKIENSL